MGGTNTVSSNNDALLLLVIMCLIDYLSVTLLEMMHASHSLNAVHLCLSAELIMIWVVLILFLVMLIY